LIFVSFRNSTWQLGPIICHDWLKFQKSPSF
jgi:hypothetical protein